MKRIYFVSLLLVSLDAGCTKEPTVSPGDIRVVPDTLSIEDRRRETLRAELTAALDWIPAIKPASMQTRMEAVAAAERLYDISRAVVAAEPDTQLATLSGQVRATLHTTGPSIFDSLRERWANRFANEVWLRGLEYCRDGAAITFTHICFSRSACIVDVHCLIEQELYVLHFDQACYTPAVDIPPATCIGLNPKADTLD